MAEIPDIRDMLARSGFSTQQTDGLVMLLAQTATQQDISNLRQEVAGLRTELHQEIGVLRSELREEIGGLRGELHREIGQIWWKMGMLLIAQAGAIVALLRVLPA